MIENTVIAKIATGIVASGCVGGTGYAYRYELYNALSSVNKLKVEENSYLIAKIDLSSKNDKSPELLTGSKKNYYCQIKDEKNKVDCEVSLVVFDDAKKTVDLKTTVKDLGSTQTETTPLKDSNENSYYKLKLNKVDLDKFDFSSEKTIDLVTNSAWSSAKYATLKPEFKVFDELITTKNNFFLAAITKITSTGSVDSSFENYKCTVDEIVTTPTPCDVYKFSQDITEINFASKTLDPIKELTTIPADSNLAVVEFKTTNENALKIVKEKVIKFQPYSSSAPTVVENDKKTYTFTVKAQLFGDLSKSTSGIFIKE